jgi:hypothetical protein
MNTPSIEELKDMAGQTPATIERGDLVAHLATIPDRVANAAAALAEARDKYARRASRLALAALEQPLFKDKREEGLPEEQRKGRPAANDTERDLAIKYVLEHDKTLREHREQMEDRQRALTRLRSQEKNYRMIARLLISQGE